MTDFFSKIAEGFTFIFDYIYSMARNLFTVFKVLGAATKNLSDVLGVLPSVLSASAILCLAVVVLNYIIGRDNQ